MFVYGAAYICFINPFGLRMSSINFGVLAKSKNLFHNEPPAT